MRKNLMRIGRRLSPELKKRVGKVFLPAIDVKTTHAVLALSREYPGYAYPMIGLHPEEVKEDWKEQLAELRKILEEHRMTGNAGQTLILH